MLLINVETWHFDLKNLSHLWLCVCFDKLCKFGVLVGFDTFTEEVGISSQESSMKRNMSLDVQFDEQDIVKVILSSYNLCLSLTILFS